MKQFIKDKAKFLLFQYHHYQHEKFYHQVMRINGIPDKPVVGERQWIKKWSGLGVKASPTQYRVFSHYIGGDINIVPEDICHDFIEPILNPQDYVGYYADKNVFDKLFPTGYMPKTIIRRMNGYWYSTDYSRIVNLTDDELLNVLKDFKKVIVKPSVDGISGVGIHLFIRENERWKDAKNKNKLSVHLIESFGDDIIIQEALNQHEYLNQFNDSSVNTLRLSIYKSVKDDMCHVTGAIMRIGGKGSIVDNAHAGGCYVGIESDGTFCHEVLDQYGRKCSTFNGVDFGNDFVYPQWNEIVEFGKSVGRFVPHHRLLALDVIINDKGTPCLIEFNIFGYAPWPFQYTTGPAFGKYTDEIIEYCKSRLSKLEHVVYL